MLEVQGMLVDLCGLFKIKGNKYFTMHMLESSSYPALSKNITKGTAIKVVCQKSSCWYGRYLWSLLAYCEHLYYICVFFKVIVTLDNTGNLKNGLNTNVPLTEIIALLFIYHWYLCINNICNVTYYSINYSMCITSFHDVIAVHNFGVSSYKVAILAMMSYLLCSRKRAASLISGLPV